jgi:hypothetical protein
MIQHGVSDGVFVAFTSALLNLFHSCFETQFLVLSFRVDSEKKKAGTSPFVPKSQKTAVQACWQFADLADSVSEIRCLACSACSAHKCGAHASVCGGNTHFRFFGLCNVGAPSRALLNSTT